MAPLAHHDTEELPHEALPISQDPRIQVAILTERLAGFSKQLHKMDKTQGEIFTLLRELGDRIKLTPGCPGTCNELKREVADHTKLINKLEGAKLATISICSGIAFVVGIASPYIIKLIFK